MIEFDEKPAKIGTNIKIVGIGGAGGNAINTMINNNLFGVEFIAANTDSSDIQKSQAKMTLQLGKKITRGLGTGANPEMGSRAAEESKDEIKSNLQDADMVFIAAGMGGGTGTGGAPVLAKIAREMGILTLGIVTTPFSFEGQKRQDNAAEGIRNLKEYVDTLIVIPNEKLNDIYPDLSLIEAFQHADNILFEAAKAVSDIINLTGYINVDFADVKAITQNMGYALMGTGIAEGENKAVNAAKAAINNPLLADVNLAGCQSMLINVTSGFDLKMSEYAEISQVISNETGSAANIISGWIIDDNMVDKVSVTLIATGLRNTENDRVIDFRPQQSVQPAGTVNSKPVPDKSDEDIEDILGRLTAISGSNRQNNEDKPRNEDTNRINAFKTDVPSFLKALD
ncbi:MAG TPA: cell division protein FtsZ [Candidatus Cloacimonadota bacterium]|nr:cell division protein FtsZ [Candidatus Cloacimonadota bacterium]HPS38860.1 cell division protein FtsZ [Candidatus Cloacimonadota bacterium]